MAPIQANAEGNFVFGKVVDARALVPATVTDGNSSVDVTQMFKSFLKENPKTGEVIPWLAQRYETSDDLTELTFKMRPGVKFHDGTDMNAEPLVF